MPSKAFKLAEAMVSNPVMSDMVENPTATPTQIAAVETKTSAISDTGVISVNTKNIVSNNVLTQSFDSNQVVGFNLTDSINTVSPIVSVFKEVPVSGVSSKGQWDVNANATNYDFYDEKPISYASSTLTPSATGDGTFTNSSPTIISNKFSLIPDHGTTQNTYATTGMSSYYINTSVNDGYSPNSSSVAVSPDGTKAIVLQWNTQAFGKQRLHSWNLQTAFGVNSAYVFQEGTGYDSVNSQWLHQGYYDVTIGGTDVAHRHGHFGVDPSGVHFYFHRSTTTYYYKASTAWDVTTLSYQNKTFAPSGNGVSGSNENVQGAEISSNGSYLIYCSGNYVATYTMSTAFDASTASSGSKQEVDVISILTSAGLTVTGGLRSAMFNSDGTELLTNIHYSGHHHRAYKFTLSTAWDITTASYVQNSESSNGGYNLKFFEQSSSDNTWVSFTVDNSVDVAIVQLDEISQFNLNDVGKKVVGNSGSAIITATSGTYQSVTAFADTSAISSWQLFSAKGKADGTGIELTASSNGYDLANASYTSTSFNTSTQMADPRSVRFKLDGTKMYVTAGSFTGDIYQYSLSTPYDLTSISYDGTMDLSTIITGYANGRSINFNSDGTKAYVSIISGSSFHDTIFEINLSTAWDTRTASYNSVSLLIESPNVTHEGVAFKPDGTKFWTISRQYDKVYAYTMTTAWDLSTASYDTVEFSVTTQASAPYDLYFKSDGTKMYILDDNDSIYEYDLSTAWDITTSTYNNISFSLANETISPKGIFMDANGLYLFAAADDTETVYKYSIGSIIHPYSQYVPALTNSSTGQINSSSWLDINSMTADETKNDGDIFYAVSTDNRTSWGVAKASDGVRKIARNNSGTWQYNNDAGSSTTSGFSLSSTSYESEIKLDTGTGGWNSGWPAESVAFNNDGTKMYGIINAQNAGQNPAVYEFSLSTAYDVSTASYTTWINVQPNTGNRGLKSHVALQFSPNGQYMYVNSATNDHLSVYTLSTAWDISTASHTRNVATTGFSTGYGGFVTSNGIIWKGALGNVQDLTFQPINDYSLSSVGSAQYISGAFGSFNPETLVANADATKIFIHTGNTGSGSEGWVEYTRSSSSAISTSDTLTQTNVWNHGLSYDPKAGQFSSDGTKMIIATDVTGGKGARVFSTTGTILSYGTSETWVNGTNNNEHATLQEALGAQSFNRMNKAQLDAIADGYHFSQDSADTLDLMIAPYAASGTSPISDGVTINYDAATLVREAIPGTDYIAEFPNNTTINIKSLVNANMKVRAL